MKWTDEARICCFWPIQIFSECLWDMNLNMSLRQTFLMYLVSTLNNSDFPINCSLPSLKLHNLTISSLSSADPSVFNAQIACYHSVSLGTLSFMTLFVKSLPSIVFTPLSRNAGPFPPPPTYFVQCDFLKENVS